MLFCAAFPFTLILFLILACFKKMQPNWGAFLYPPAMVLLAWGAFYKKWKIWLHIGTWISIFMVLCSFAIPFIQMRTNWPLPYGLNPFRQLVGWNKLPEILNQIGYDPKNEFLFGDKYQAASLLSFYSPEKKRAYFFNISDTRKNQFSYWPQMEQKEKGKNGYFLVLENTKENTLEWYRVHYQRRLSPYFKRVEYVGAYPLFYVEGKPVKYALIFKGFDYLGTFPAFTEKY